MRILRLVLVVAFVLIIATSGIHATRAQVDRKYFPETGHYITGQFFQYYYSVPGPDKLFGYPITESFTDTKTGLTIQYFERARFELHLDEPPDRRVQLTAAGRYLHPVEQPKAVAGNQPACQALNDPQNGGEHLVCYSFLDFYMANGGLAQFGFPISDMELENGMTVQYFERARFEWHPGLNGNSYVMLSDVGSMLFYHLRENQARLGPVTDNAAPETPVDIKARAYPGKAITGQSGQQEIDVVVFNQQGAPVQNADVSVTVRLPSGAVQRYIAGSTDKTGIVKVTFFFNKEMVGMARVEVVASLNGKETSTSTSFRIWW